MLFTQANYSVSNGDVPNLLSFDVDRDVSDSCSSYSYRHEFLFLLVAWISLTWCMHVCTGLFVPMGF